MAWNTLKTLTCPVLINNEIDRAQVTVDYDKDDGFKIRVTANTRGVAASAVYVGVAGYKFHDLLSLALMDLEKRLQHQEAA